MHLPHGQHEYIALQNIDQAFYICVHKARGWRPAPVFPEACEDDLRNEIRSSALLLPAPSDRLTTLLLPVVSHSNDAHRILPRWAFGFQGLARPKPKRAEDFSSKTESEDIPPATSG